MRKSISEKIFVWSMIFSLVFWSFGSPINFFIPGARASGGVTPNYLSETEGMDIMMTSTSTIYAIGEFNIFDSYSGSLNSLTVTLKDVPETTGFNPNVDLSALSSTATSSGMSLWEDNGDGHFSIASDTPAGNISLNWTSTASGWQASFSSINWSYPASINKKVYIAFKAANISTSSPKGFETIIETGGMVFTGGSISSWPDNNHYFPPVWIGAAGAGGFGSPVLISEIQTAGASTSDEFIELYNRSPMAVNLGGWRVKYTSGTASGTLPWMTIYSFSTSSPPSIEPGGYYLLGHGSLSTSTDASLPADSLSETGGYVGLFDGQGGAMDWVGYGSLTDAALAEGGQAAYAPAASSSIERKAFHDSIYTMMIAGGTDQFMGNGEDSNNNAMDFIIRPTSEPQSSNAAAEVPEGGASGGSPVLVNEIYYRPSTAGLGWVEIFNRSDTTQNIGNFVLKHKNWSYTFPGGISDIPANNYLLVKWNQGVPDATGSENGYNYIETGSLGMDLDTYGGDIILLDNSSNIMDYVEFGGTNYANEANATGHQEWMAGDYVPHCLTGQSIGRRSTDGEDWNNAGDWQTFASPSPGMPNMGGDSTSPDSVGNLVLSDNDLSANSGLDGRDISVNWTPVSTVDPSFDRYEIFLLPEGTQIDFMSHKPIDSIYGGQYQYDASGTPLSSFSYTGGEFITKDSAGTLLSDGNYVAYVFAFDSYGNKSGTAQSAPATLSEEAYSAGNDNTLPFIMHMGVWNATAGSDLHLIARADDDRMLSSTTPLRVVWKAGTDFSFSLNTGATTDNCSLIQASFYDCVISWSGVWDENTVIGYYLKALDDAHNQSFMSASPDADISGSEATVAHHPFYIDIMPVPSDAGTEADLSGSTYSWDGNILASTTVFFEGLAIAPATSNASGTFAFADNILDYGMYRAMAVKEGYMNMPNDVYRGDAVSFYLNEGDMNMSGGGGDAGGNPIVTWTAPFDNMMGAPIDIFCTGDCSLVDSSEMPVVIAFDRPMNDSTINDQNAADSASNIYLTTTGADRVSGKVYYDSDSNEARFYTTNHNTLTLGTYYNIVVTQAVTDELGNPVMGSNSDGSFSSAFTTIISTTTDYSHFGTGGASMPPYVMSVTPAPGSFNIPRSTSAVIEFSEPMDPAKINNSTIKLVPITDSASWTEGPAVAATVSLDQATRKIATINPISDLNASYDWWVVKVMGDAKSSSGMYMADPNSVGGCADWAVCSELNAVTAYESSFQISTGGVDTTKPTVTGTYPNNNDGIISSGTAVNVGIGALEIGFSEAMDPGTINAQNIKLRAGSSLSGGKVSYDPASNNAKFMPASALLANTQYTLRISADCLDLSGNQLNATTSVYFKTGAADTAAPEVMYANGDDYSIALTFNEPMNAAKRTNTENWPYSVLNPANYAINGFTYQACANQGSWSCGVNLLTPYNGATGTPLSGLGLSFSYEDYNNTVIIEGFSFDHSTTDFQIFVDNVRDRSNNEVADSGKRAADNSHLNAARAPLYDSANTDGALGPGAVDNNMDMGDMGMMMAGAFPMNAMAGQNSAYFIDIPTTKSIPIGGKIIITFPAGFDISSAVKDPYSSVNNDINEQNAGKVTIDSVASDQSARTITIIATTSATQAADYLHMDIKGIVNSNIPKDFGTEGYRTDIKTFTADGALLETINTMPFFITEAGNLTISGNISGLSSGDSGTMSVYLGSPITGPMEAEISVDEANSPDGTYSFTNLPDGEYYIFTDPTITINGNDYFGNPHSEPIWLNGASSSKNIALQAEATGGAAVTVSLTGDFTTGGVADDVDVFAGSPSSFRVKKLSGLGNVSGATTTLYLSQGDWMIGIGPSIPENVSGAPPMTDWMPPMNVYYSSDGSTSGNVNFSISGQSTTTVSGTVVDGSGAGIADAEVYAYQPMGGYGGSFTKTATDGSFALKIPVLGTYMIGAHKPGLPEPKEKYVDVSANVSGLTIKITKPSYTISGKVLNSSGNAIAYASVWTSQESGSGHADTMSDASGNYILYVNAGTWHVEADAPGIGWMEYGLSVTTNATNTTDINISPSADTAFYTISGEVGISTDSTYSVINTPFANTPIRAVQYSSSTGAYLGKEFNAMTNSNGEYTISVPAGAYRVDTWTERYGEIGVNNQDNDNNLNEVGADDDYANNRANVDASSGNVSSANIVVAQTGLRNVYIVINNAPASQEGYLNIEGVNFSGGYAEPTGFNMFRRIDDLNATTTIKLADGDYFMFLDVSGYGGYIPDKSDRHITKDDIDISGTSTVHFTMPDTSSGMVTITGTVYSGSESGGNELADAWIWIGNPNNGYHNGTESESNGTYSLVIPTGSGYKLGADKPGFMSEEPTSLDGSASSTGNNIVLTPQGSTISGYIYTDENSNSAYDSGEGVPNGFVRAETTECSDSDTSNDSSCIRSHAPVDGTGAYEIGVVNGIWKVYGMADGYAGTEYGINITISGSSASGKNIKLTVDSNWTTKSKNKSITPASGGSLDDTDPDGTGIKLTIPPNALGNSNSSGDVNAQKTSSVTKTNSSDPVGGEAVTITATDNSGQAITNLDDYIDVEMVLYKAEVDAAIAAEELTYAKLKNTKNAYWDSTANDWVNLATTRKAYYKENSSDTEWTLYASSTSDTPAFENFINQVASSSITVYDYKLVYISKTNHLTVFAVIMPFVAVPAQASPPAGPNPVTPTGGGGSYINYCTSAEYGVWGDCVDGTQTRAIGTTTPASCKLTFVQEALLQRECVVGEEDKTEENIVSPEITPVLFKTIDQLYFEQGEFIARADVDEILPALGIVVRKHKSESLSRRTLTDRLGIKLGDYEPRVQYALTNFITYGSPDTYKLGWGERAGVLNSFMAAFGKVAQTADDWSDVIKIANGRWPQERSEQAENQATEHFRKIYLRDPDRNNPHDDAAVTVIAYGLRPANRNMDSEAAAIRIFKAIYDYAPRGATDWDVVRAIAYSGAVR